MQKRMNLEKILREKLQQIHRDRKLSWLAEQTGIAQSTLSRAVNNATTVSAFPWFPSWWISFSFR